MLRNPYSYPTDYVIETATHCNLKCNFCARQFTDLKHEPMSVNQFKKVIDKLPWCKIVRIGVQGEPLLYEGNFDIMRYLEKIHTICSITSNCTVLTEKIIKKLPMNVKILYASVDAGSQEVYDIYRDKANFQTWVNNIINIRKLRPDINVQVNYLLFKNNLYDIPKMINICAKYKLSLSSTFPVIFTKQFAKEHDAYWLDDLAEIIKRNRIYAQIKGVPYICSSGNMEWRTCDLPWMQPLIGIQGDVYTDFFIYQPRNYDKNKPIIWEEWYKDEMKKVPQHEYIMGNIFEQSWKDIWNKGYKPFLKRLDEINCMNYTSEDFRKVRDTVNQFSDKWEWCKICGRRWGISY